MPKLYFYDTGLACHLLRIASARDLFINPAWGSLFECFIIADIAKQYFNDGHRPPIYFWRDKNGRIEIDCLIDNHGTLSPIEIKGSLVTTANFFNGLKQWSELMQATSVPDKKLGKRFLVYAGQQAQVRTNGTVVPWEKCGNLVQKLE